MDSHDWFQRPLISAFVNALLLGTATVAGIAIRDTIDEGPQGNLAFFGVVVATHFGILTLLAVSVGYGGGMISSRPTVPLRDRWTWYVNGDDYDAMPKVSEQQVL